MGLVLNNLSGSISSKQQTTNTSAFYRSTVAVTGSTAFLPAEPGKLTSDGRAAPLGDIFAKNRDSAFIVSGSVGGKDKALFLGDVVISGSLSLGAGGTFLEGSLDAGGTRIPFTTDADTLEDDIDLKFIKAGGKNATSGKEGAIMLGNAAGDNVAINLAAGNLQLFADDANLASGFNAAGLLTDANTKLEITGAKVEGISTEIGGFNQVVLGQNGTLTGSINIRSLSSTNASTDSGNGAIRLLADAGGIVGKFAASKDLKLGNAADDLYIHMVDDASTAANEKITVLNSAGTAEAAIKVNSVAGGVDIDAAAGKDVSIEGGQVLLAAKDNAAHAIKLHTNVGSSENIFIHNQQGEGTFESAGTPAIGIYAQAGSMLLDAEGKTHVGGSHVQLEGDGSGEEVVYIAASGNNAADTMFIWNRGGTRADAINIEAGAGGVGITGSLGGASAIALNALGNANAGITMDARAGGITMNGTAGDVTLRTVSSGKIDLTSAGLIDLNSSAGSAAAVELNAASGGVTILSNGTADASNSDITMTAGNNFTIDAKGTTSGDGFNITLGTDTAATGFRVSNNSGAEKFKVDAAGDVTVAGNLTVNGTTATIDTTNLKIEDKFLMVATGSTGLANNRDGGFIIHSGSSTLDLAFGRVANDVFGVVKIDSADGTVGSLSGGTLVNLRAATLEADTIAEVTSNNGVEVDGVTLKDGNVAIADGGTIGNATTADVLTLASSGIVTFKDDIIIKDTGTIGSTSDTDAIAIASNGQVSFSAATGIKVDTLSEYTTDAGVTIEGITIEAGSSEQTIGNASDPDAISFGSSGISFTNTNSASSSASGPVKFAGGVGIAGSTYIGGNLGLDADSATINMGSTGGGVVGMLHNASFRSVDHSSETWAAFDDFNTNLTLSSVGPSTSGPTWSSSGYQGSSLDAGTYIIIRDGASSSSNGHVFMLNSTLSNGAASGSWTWIAVVSAPSAFSGDFPYGSAITPSTSSGATRKLEGAASASTTPASWLYGNGSSSAIHWRQSGNKVYSSTSNQLDIGAVSKVAFKINDGSEVLSVDSNSVNLAQALLPTSDNAVNLGSQAARFANIYTGDLNLRNDRGDWTLIEEEDFISFRNNKTGRRFRMVMEDITGLGIYGPGNDGEM